MLRPAPAGRLLRLVEVEVFFPGAFRLRNAGGRVLESAYLFGFGPAAAAGTLLIRAATLWLVSVLGMVFMGVWWLTYRAGGARDRDG